MRSAASCELCPPRTEAGGRPVTQSNPPTGAAGLFTGPGWAFTGFSALPSCREPFCLVMAESAAAVAELDATLAVDGVDGLYVGPRDLSLSLGCELDPDDPVLNQALQRVWAACAAAGKPAGVHAVDGAMARRYREAGCTLITTAADAAAITRDTTAQFSLARARAPG
jgi:2-keto-3-deoxy-L-rhamnonate aldolase RhmA